MGLPARWGWLFAALEEWGLQAWRAQLLLVGLFKARAPCGSRSLVMASLNFSLLQAKETLLWPWALPAAGSLLGRGLGSALPPVPLPTTTPLVRKAGG